MHRWVFAACAAALLSGCGGDGGEEAKGGGGAAGAGGESGEGGGSTGEGGSGALHCVDVGDAGAPADPGEDCKKPGARFATHVVRACFGDGDGFGRDGFPENVFGPPKGEGDKRGSLDVLSIGEGGTITVAFEGNAIVDGPGPDFTIFENVFLIGGDAKNPFAQPALVEVSEDGKTFVAFPCTAQKFPWGSCAGWHPVYANPDTNDVDPLDPKRSGGDSFDLADVGLSRARFVRITDREDLGGDFDLDAVAIVNAACP